MFILNGFELIKSLNTGQILTGLDLGDKTIGIAISDNNFIIGSPLKTIIRKGTASDTKILNSLFKEYGEFKFIPINNSATRLHKETKSNQMRSVQYDESIKIVKNYNDNLPLKWPFYKFFSVFVYY